MVERFWKWTCGDCGTVITQKEWGLPPYWRVVKLSIKHVCSFCKANYEEKQFLTRQGT